MDIGKLASDIASVVEMTCIGLHRQNRCQLTWQDLGPDERQSGPAAPTRQDLENTLLRMGILSQREDVRFEVTGICRLIILSKEIAMNVIHYVFITFIAMLAITFSTYSSATLIPDQSDPSVLPEQFPCVYHADKGITNCRWTYAHPSVRMWNDRSGQYETYHIQSVGTCLEDGECYASGHYIGHAGVEGQVYVQIHYYVGPSTDGKSVAYRNGTGPGYGGQMVSYSDSIKTYLKYMRRYGYDENHAISQMAATTKLPREEIVAALQAPATASNTAPAAQVQQAVEAWCNPRADDECYINDVQVPISQLDKYLPRLDPDVVEANGGFCEYPICYDSNNKTIGFRQSY